MYINVKLLNGFQQPLTYKIPSEWDPARLLGGIVTVPLQKRTELALVTEIVPVLIPEPTFKIRQALHQEQLPADPHYGPFIEKLSAHYCEEPMVFYKRFKKFLEEEETDLTHTASSEKISAQLPQLTDEQQTAVQAIVHSIHKDEYQPFLLHGVTGSGKTELYKRAMAEAFTKGKTILFLVPEISLAVQFAHIFKATLPHIPCFGFHSATSVTEKKDLWHLLLNRQPLIIVGVHLPLLLPLPNLGLIIIDEEHDQGFQEKKYPKINSKEMALVRAHLSKIPIVLGSATPSVQSLHNVKHKHWKLLTLHKRFAGAFPTLRLVPLLTNKPRAHFWISPDLEAALKDRLDRKEQTIIFINRRGYSFFVQCAACSFIFECASCSVSLTLHEDNSLRCHYCTFTMHQPDRCTACKPNKPTLLKKGIGTQQIVAVLNKLFPSARIARADLDSTINKKKWNQTITDFHKGEIDILVGTQTITKGYHFPKVTLVGIIWADINLSLPFYTAAETTLQQLIQVAGRAGRQSPESLVIIQSMMKHPVYNYLNEEQYPAFYDYEIKHRQELQYPPYIRFAEIEMRHENEGLLDRESQRLASILCEFKAKKVSNLIILGPAKPPVHKIKNVFSRKIYLKGESFAVLQAAYRVLEETKGEIQVFFTPNPLQ